LEQELIVGIVAHRSIHELHLTPTSFKFFNEKHLMHVVASKSIRSCDNNAIKGRASHLLPKSIKTWPRSFAPL